MNIGWLVVICVDPSIVFARHRLVIRLEDQPMRVHNIDRKLLVGYAPVWRWARFPAFGRP